MENLLRTTADKPSSASRVASRLENRQQSRRPRRRSRWQAEKSLRTRVTVLEATIQCLVDKGYVRTTMDLIARQAKVSRGAMTHHFRSRFDVIRHATAYLVDKRLAEFENLVRMGVSPLQDGSNPTLKHMVQTVSLVREFYQLPSFAAWQELLGASRTDKKLDKIVRAGQQRLNNEVTPIILRVFPFWAEKSPTLLLLLHDLVHFVSRGVAMSYMDELDAERLARLERLVAEVAHREYAAAP